MKILDIADLPLAGVKTIRYARFCDSRGYFTETFRRGDFDAPPLGEFLGGVEFRQCNESCSRAGVIRGLHMQWNPRMGKLIRTVRGHMMDLVLDIRKGSATFGKAIAYDMPDDPQRAWGEWIWVPPGFAHGNCYLQQTTIEYFCTSQWNPACEASISPLANDLDWSPCEPAWKAAFDRVAGSQDLLIHDKDRNGLNLAAWASDPRSENFVHG